MGFKIGLKRGLKSMFTALYFIWKTGVKIALERFEFQTGNNRRPYRRHPSGEHWAIPKYLSSINLCRWRREARKSCFQSSSINIRVPSTHESPPSIHLRVLTNRCCAIYFATCWVQGCPDGISVPSTCYGCSVRVSGGCPIGVSHRGWA